MQYKVQWSKTYIRSGFEMVEASSEKEAEEKLDSIIGNLDGSIQYIPEDNTIDAYPSIPFKKGNKVKIIKTNITTSNQLGTIEEFNPISRKYKIGFDSSWVGWYKFEELELQNAY